MQRLAASARASPPALAAAAAPFRGFPSTTSGRTVAAAIPASSRRRRGRSAVVLESRLIAIAASASALDAVADAIDEATGERTQEIKAQLLDSLFGTERGLSASSEVRAEINELITALEARNAAAPLDSNDEDEGQGSLSSLLGVWKLAYTSSSELVPLLALGKLPFVTVGDVTQTISTDNLTGVTSAVNAVSFSVPFSTTSVSTTAAVDVVSAKRVAVRFERGRVATPQVASDVSSLRDEIPESVTVAGQTVDLSGIKSALLIPAVEAAGGIAQRLSGALRRAPDLDFPLPRSEKATTWLINTYIDEDTRIARGDGGSVFVMVKEEEEELQQRASTVAEIDAVSERKQSEAAIKEVEAEALIDE